MLITLNHEEILIALKNYANEIISLSPNQEISIDLKAGRGENGYTATLDIVPKRTTAISQAAPTQYTPPVKEAVVEAPEAVAEEVSLEEVELTPEEEDALIDSVMQAPTKSLFARS